MESASLGRDTVTENVKKRISKWDLVADPHSATETVQDNSKSGGAADVHHDKDSSSGWNLSKSAGNHVRKWSEMRGEYTMRSKDSFDESCWESMPEGKRERKYSSVDRGDETVSPTTRPYGASDAPRVDAWRQHSRSRSPKSGWGRSYRSRSRSPQRFRREAEGWTDRGRNGRGGSTAPCRDFTAGRCRRGSQCRFAHQDGDYDDRGHFDSGHFENRGHRQERGGFSRYARDETFTDPEVQSGYPQDRLLHGYEGHYDGDREKREPQRNSRSSTHCNDFLKGKCYRGSACKYVHDIVNADGYGRWSSKDATRERSHGRREDTSFGHDQRRESFRSGNGLCKYFAEGRCRNGERCKFSHQGPTQGSSEWKSQDAGLGDDSIMGNRSWEGPKWSDKDSGSEVACPENQSWNDPKWSDNTGDRNLSSNQSSGHSKWGDNTCDINFTSNQSFDRPKWGDKDSDKNISISPWCNDTNNIKADDSGMRSWKDPTWGDKAALTNISNSPLWKSSDDGTGRVIPDSRAADQFCNGADVASARGSGDGYPRNMGGKESKSNAQDSHTENPEAEGERQHVSSSATLTQSVALENSYIQQHPGLKADNTVFPCEDHNKFTDSARVQHENLFGMSAIVPSPGQSSVESAQNQHALLPQPASNAHSFKPNEQNQQMAFSPNVLNLNLDRQSQQIALPPPNAQNFNPSGPNQQTFASLPSGPNVNLNGQSQSLAPPLLSGQTDSNGHSQQLMMQAPSEARDPVLLGKEESTKNPDLPQPTSGNPVPQNAVTNEKGTQMTDLSASLAQIFGNGQQLPQLYATLNHLSANGLVPSHVYSESNSARPSEPLPAPFIHPNQGLLPQKQYDPIQGSTESIKPAVTNQLPVPRFPVDIDEQKNASFQQLLVPQQIMAPSSVTDGRDDCGPPKIGSLEQSSNENNELSMDVLAVEVNEVATIQCQKDQEMSHLKDMNVDDQVDEGKRNKDEKGMKMFKFALVEFVKELLKPTWKEGHMSREAHKTIVKKVVDKVTGSMQGPHLPQTQEKIDQYLSFSKPKLTKLVDAYVEKYLKI